MKPTYPPILFKASEIEALYAKLRMLGAPVPGDLVGPHVLAVLDEIIDRLMYLEDDVQELWVEH